MNARSQIEGITSTFIRPELLQLLVCPRDKENLRVDGNALLCAQGHRYAVVEGIPILLLSDVEQTHIEGTRSIQVAESGDPSLLPQFNVGPKDIDPFVQKAIGATNGGLYQYLIDNLPEYPIPNLRLPPGQNRMFLEIGCNWGRWCFSAARAGYRVIGIDPSLKSIRAANRVARQLGISAIFLVADGRYLPFRDESFEQVFSYSTLQHLSKGNAASVLSEIQRVLCLRGHSLVQMPNVFGVRCLYHEIRRGFHEGRDFDVRYWRPGELLKTFKERIGPSSLSVDGYFSLNPQVSDMHLMPLRFRTLVLASEGLRRLSRFVPILANVADSLYVSSEKTKL
jgi:uncharacterized protein YbaR (Trm112 family)